MVWSNQTKRLYGVNSINNLYLSRGTIKIKVIENSGRFTITHLDDF